MSRKENSGIARDWKDRRQDENNPLPELGDIVLAIREAQLSAAETVREEAVEFLRLCLLSSPRVAEKLMLEVVEGRRKEF